MRTKPILNERFIVRCTEDLRRALEAQAEKEGQDLAQVVRTACEHYLARAAKPKGRAAA
jgi:predicted HicB family RNase H-like nuclease